MRKRWWWDLAALTVALIVLATFAIRPTPDRITRENYERIHHCTTRTEVEAILGLPGDYQTGPTGYPEGHGTGGGFALESGSSDRVEATATTSVWKGDTLDIWVDFGASGKVTGGFYSTRTRVDEGPLGNLLWRAKRQWRRWFPE